MATTQAQIDALGSRMGNSLDELKGMISSFDERLRKVETSERSYQELLATLNKSLDKGFDELKVMSGMFDARLRDVEHQEAACQPLLESKINAALKKTDKHDEDLIALQKTVNDLAFVVYRMEGIARWIMGVVTALVVAILVAVMTGKVTLLVG